MGGVEVEADGEADGALLLDEADQGRLGPALHVVELGLGLAGDVQAPLVAQDVAEALAEDGVQAICELEGGLLVGAGGQPRVGLRVPVRRVGVGEGRVSKRCDRATVRSRNIFQRLRKIWVLERKNIQFINGLPFLGPL